MADKIVTLQDPTQTDRLFPVVSTQGLYGKDGSKYDVEGKIEELKTSVSEGKALIAAAVTDQGVETAATDTFQKMAENIGEIKGQLSGKTGTATILNGATGDDLSAGQKVYCRPKSSTLMNLFDISGFRPSGISTSDTISAMHAVKITDNRCIVVYTTKSYKTRIYASVLEYDSTKNPHYRRILNSSTYLSMDIEISSYRPVEVLLTFHENEYGGIGWRPVSICIWGRTRWSA